MALVALAIAPAGASTARGDPLAAYARARAADAEGAVLVAAQGYAAALTAMPEDEVIAIRAYREGLASGDMALARRGAAVLVRSGVAPADHAVLAYADAVLARDARAGEAALTVLAGSPLDFLVPVLRAWGSVSTGSGDPIALLDDDDANAFTRRYAAENRALLLIAAGRIDEGIGAIKVLLGPTRDSLDLRLNAALLLAGQGQKAAAAALLAGDGPLAIHAARLGRGVRPDLRFGASRLFARVAADLSADGTETLAIVLTRAALLLDPGYHRARLALADALAREGALAQARATLAQVPAKDSFAAAARGVEIAILTRSGNATEALAAAEALARAPAATSANARNYADLLLDAGRYDDAAAAYATAIERDTGAPEWALYLQRGGALEQGGNWAEALPMLRRAAELAPEEPAVLNYLGYAQAERGENLAEALRLLERASRLSPDDAAITDSLGWVHYQRGDVARALPLLERAARDEPGDATIHEHLGDAYWRSGRRYEARYAWQAAAGAADGAAATRIAGKIADGLPPQAR